MKPVEKRLVNECLTVRRIVLFKLLSRFSEMQIALSQLKSFELCSTKF